MHLKKGKQKTRAKKEISWGLKKQARCACDGISRGDQVTASDGTLTRQQTAVLEGVNGLKEEVLGERDSWSYKPT